MYIVHICHIIGGIIYEIKVLGKYCMVTDVSSNITILKEYIRKNINMSL